MYRLKINNKYNLPKETELYYVNFTSAYNNNKFTRVIRFISPLL